jgi:hypothetical protein
MIAASTNELAERIVDWCLPLGLILLAIAAVVTLIELVISYSKGPAPAKPGPAEHGSMDGMAKLATALKDLNASGRLLLAGLVLVGYAATAAGLDAVSSETSDQETEQGE